MNRRSQRIITLFLSFRLSDEGIAMLADIVPFRKRQNEVFEIQRIGKRKQFPLDLIHRERFHIRFRCNRKCKHKEEQNKRAI